MTGSFDTTAGIWRKYADAGSFSNSGLKIERGAEANYEHDVAIDLDGNDGDDEQPNPEDWEFSLVLEGHDAEIKGVAFSPSGQYLATCSRDKSVWVWEDIGAEGEDEWETVAVLQEHEGDVKAVAWCADTNGEGEVLASASYDDTVRLWREDGEGEWVCVARLEGHEGTVWGLDWEGLEGRRMPNGDMTEEEAQAAKSPARLITCSADFTVKVWKRESEAVKKGDASEIPSTIRPMNKGEDWVVEATLPKAHDRAIYSVNWSKRTGRVVSTGSDSRVVVYEEKKGANGQAEWQIVATLAQGHGPYEINHATWCPRFDGGRKGEEEMIITTGDDGKVMAWSLDP